MPSTCLLNMIRVFAFTMCLLVIAPTLIFAQDEDTSAADDYSNTHIAATGTDLFAVPIPGEIYSPFIGKISHRSTDMVIKGNGPLSIAITREHEETPQAYPYALGTMSVNEPPAKAGGFGLRLKAGLIGHTADSCSLYTTSKSSSGSGGF